MVTFSGSVQAAMNADLLTLERETELGHIIKQGQSKTATPDEVKASEKAVEELVIRNTRLVAKIAREHQHGGIEYDDLVSEGLIGLVIAARRFDPARGSFCTYSSFWIKQRMNRFYYRNADQVRLPEAKFRDRAKVAKEIGIAINATGCAPSTQELVETTGLPANVIADLYIHCTAPVRLDTECLNNGDENGSHEQMTPDELCVKPADVAIRHEELAALATVLDSLEDKERQIITHRFGLGCEPETLETVGKRFSVTRERIRQIEDNTLKKMKKRLRLAVLTA